MAEFKLGRIRFVWKDIWIPARQYFIDDVIRNSGNTYICIEGHVSSALFSTDENQKWNKVSEGQQWRDQWQTETLYNVNDIVVYGGYVYIANTEHISATNESPTFLGLENDQSKWDRFAEGFEYRSDWTVSTKFRVNDLVKYGSTVYICIDPHISTETIANGLEVDQAKWETFSKGLDWKAEWSIDFRYKVNDIVKYGGQIYVCNEGHTSAATETLGLETDQSKWDFFHKGFDYKELWESSVRYKVNDVVKYGGGTWICITHHTSQSTFEVNEANWLQFADGIQYEDEWSPTKRYQIGDFINYGGFAYIAATNNIESKPTENTADWKLFTSGFKFVGEWAEDSSNQNFKVGEVVTLNGFTYLCTQDHETETRPPNVDFWEKLNSGFFWKDAWIDNEIYNQGDVVRRGDFSYVCIFEHRSDEVGDKTPLKGPAGVNRPDQDVNGDYWNLISGGVEVNVLTTDGDLVYYSGTGPTRLPIGESGQVLTVNSAGELPEWNYLGQVNHVYYVETENGADLPAPIYGTTIDQSWKTVRYAAEQVDYGPLRPNARFFLERNRSFIQAEVLAYAASETLTITNTVKFEQDIGLLIDAVVYDLTHGGNERSIESAKSHLISNGLFNGESTGDIVTAINYAETIIVKIIANFDPDDSYQNTITQVKNLNIVVESNTLSLIDTLLSIITDTITAGNTNSLPTVRRPNNSIFVKTGVLAEVLPIIVPHETSIIGDELRSTKITAAGSLIASSDTPYTLDALSRLEEIIKNAISDPSSIVKTSGNTLDPVTDRPAGTAAVGDIAEALVEQIQSYINFEINEIGDSTVLVTTGSNIPNASTDFTYGVESLEANREFIKAEIAAYIAFTYPGYTYNVDLCLRDIDRYIDAIKYDLIYPGNYKSLLSARYYVNAVRGSQLEDMFYLRNGTGLRNFTVNGLNGTLIGPNQFGTFRPSAGAYSSLDPGWGPDDDRTWILKRSPYVQNVSTFGTGCVGLKVDGALHNGGNDSIVANDFTQLISDGIGYWVTNLGRSELVSVFTYYAHIGYLAENGGKIRATNGNNSYGSFGSVSEGVDDSETPITAQVDNRSLEASIRRTITNGNNILVFEYGNAGQNYTPAGTNFIVSGEGFGAVIDEVQTVNGGIFNIRLIDENDDSSGQFGGDGFKTSTNVAQSGNATSITIANTDTVVNSGAYIGMSIYIIAGLGAGQYGYISNYNAGIKLATISRAGAKITAGNFVPTTKYIITNLGDTDFEAIGAVSNQIGIVFEATSAGSGTGKALELVPGWDHVIAGTSIASALDGTTQYVIEPSIIVEEPANDDSSLEITAKARPVVDDGKIVEIFIWNPGSGYDPLIPPNVIFVDPEAAFTPPYQVRIADGVLTQPTWTNRGTAFATASARVEGDGFADNYQSGTFVRIKNLSEEAQLGSNVVFDNIPNKTFKLVFVRELVGPTGGPFTAELQISPALQTFESPEHETDIELRIRYSQIRLTGHDFLDIGTGNFESTNYPGTPLQDPQPANETVELGGGRVFYTSTDQDGNFRVGELFSVEQSTGIATLDADAFNITGLQELTLGELGLGSTGAVITEFSTDGTFSADSDNIVPTQRAIKTFITSQIGGGAATLNVNNITAGQIQISGQQITTTTGVQINVFRKLNLLDGVDGVPLALNYFLT
jgi:hypothetical protein